MAVTIWNGSRWSSSAMPGNRFRAGIAAVAGVTLAAAGAAPAQAATSWAVLAGGLVGRRPGRRASGGGW